MRNQKVLLMTYLSVFLTIMVIMGWVPGFGFIPVGPFSVTLLQIPVVIAGIYFGKKFGTLTGLIFGLTSLVISYIRPTQLFDYFFQNPLISVLPRILFAYFTVVIYNALKNIIKNNVIRIGLTSFIGSMLNSLFVLGFALFIYVKDFGGFTAGLNIILGVLATASLIEAVICMVIATAVIKALHVFYKKDNLNNKLEITE